MPQGQIGWVEIPAADLDRDPTFYEEIFGWKVTRDEGSPGYVMFQDTTGSVGGAFYTQIKPAPEGGPLVYITVDDIEVTAKEIEARGGSIVTPRTLIAEHVGWWAGFMDPAGNRMFLYQSSQGAQQPS